MLEKHIRYRHEIKNTCYILRKLYPDIGKDMV